MTPSKMWFCAALLPSPAVSLALAWAGAVSAEAADLPVFRSLPPFQSAIASGGGGFRAPLAPVRPAPLRYDIYGYPLPFGLPNPLAVGSGCPAAIQPDYDPDGNLAGYAALPMCR